MSVTTGQNTTATATVIVDPAERTQALADARRRASQSALANAEAGETRRADRMQDARAIIERALGANTKLSISRDGASPTYIYRAIDVDTGEVIREWPPAEFVEFIAQQNKSSNVDDPSGVVVDEQA